MKTLLIVLGVVLCLAIVQARSTENNADEQSNGEQPESISSIRDYRAGQMRHQRKRWKMNYGYDYPNPYYPNRRVYEIDQMNYGYGYPATNNPYYPNRRVYESDQMNYGYNYPAPNNPYYPNTRVYESDQNLLPKILGLLDEIGDYLRCPPPPPLPQPIYVPYPVPQNCTFNVNQDLL